MQSSGGLRGGWRSNEERGLARPAALASASGSAPTTVIGNGIVGANHFPAWAKRTSLAGPAHTNGWRSGRGHSHLSRDRRWRRPGVRFRSGQGRHRSQPHRRELTTPGLQNFTFIGSAPFNGGAQVRYRLNPTNNVTYVRSRWPVISRPILRSRSLGWLPLTAANFALTPAQSSADLADGACYP